MANLHRDDAMNRRRFMGNLAVLSSSALLAGPAAGATMAPPRQFKLGAISDGFSQNFEQALGVMKNYGLRWVEIRKVFGIYNTEATPAQVQQMKELVNRY